MFKTSLNMFQTIQTSFEKAAAVLNKIISQLLVIKLLNFFFYVIIQVCFLNRYQYNFSL